MIRRLLAALAGDDDEEIRVDLAHLHRALHDFDLRRKRQQDDIRIMTRADVDLKALRSRMRRGLSPSRRMLDDVRLVWGVRSRGEAVS